MSSSEIRTRKTGIRSLRIRLAASILSLVATVLLVAAIEVWTGGPSIGPSGLIRPAACLFEGLPVPCS